MAANLSGTPVIGRRFGNYVVEALIGAGGMGAVYRAVQPEIGKQVALKFLSAALSAQPELVQRFFAEARAVNLIQHDNIVDIFDFGSGDGISWFVMELLRGRSLSAVLMFEGKLAVARSIDILAQIADAISAAHARGIIHRDLKGDNIFVVTHGGREDFVKILDFGIAKLSDPGSMGAGNSHTRTGAILGTPGYMSPEQGTGGTVDGRTDVYALGVIAYRMLTGRLPFEGLNHLEIVQKQLTEIPPKVRTLRPETPPALAELVEQMLEKKSEARPQKMSEVRDRLRALQTGAPLRAPSQNYPIEPTIGADPVSRPTTLSGANGQVGTGAQTMARRRRRGLWVATAGLVAVSAVAAFVFLRPVPAQKPAAVPSVVPPVVTNLVKPRPKPAVVVKPAVVDGFDCFIETDPAGAQVLRAGHSLGATPLRLKLKDDPTTVKLRLSGYGDEDLEIGRDTEHAIVRLHKLTAPPPASEPPAKKPLALPKPPTETPVVKPKPKKPSIGLDD